MMNRRLPLALYSGLLLFVVTPLAMAQQPVVTISAKSLKFGILGAGTMSPVQVVTLTNTGTAALTITQLSAGARFTCSTMGAPQLLPATVAALALCSSRSTTGTYSSAVTIVPTQVGGNDQHIDGMLKSSSGRDLY